MIKEAVLVVLLACACNSFIVEELELTHADMVLLSNNTVPLFAREELLTSIILPKMRAFNQSSILIEPGDLTMKMSRGDERIRGGCQLHVEARHQTATGTVLSSSQLRFGASDISWKEINIFADARINAQIHFSFTIHADAGTMVFGHCAQWASDSWDASIDAKGLNGLGVTFTAKSPRIDWSSLEIVFTFHAEVIGVTLDWSVDHLTLSGCDVDVLGFRVGSFCHKLEDYFKDWINDSIQKEERIQAPKIAAKLQSMLGAAIGSEVRIPLKRKILDSGKEGSVLPTDLKWMKDEEGSVLPTDLKWMEDVLL